MNINDNVQSQYITSATRMTTDLNCSGISHFDPHADTSSLSQRRNMWIKRFQRFIVAMDIKDPTHRQALLLYLPGPEVETIFDNLPDTV